MILNLYNYQNKTQVRYNFGSVYNLEIQTVFRPTKPDKQSK